MGKIIINLSTLLLVFLLVSTGILLISTFDLASRIT